MTASDERARIVEHVRDALQADAGPVVDVLDAPLGDAPATRARVIVAVRTVDNANAGCSTRSYGFDVWVVTAKQEPGPADVDVDGVLDRVLNALDTLPRSGWTTAERGVWQESYPGYRVETETRP